MKLKYITNPFKISLIILTLFFIPLSAHSELSIEETIKGRKAIFSKNYSTAKRVQSLSSKGDFEKAKNLMLEMSENYKSLIKYFPDNTKEGFKTEALPTIWENKDEFNELMTKASNDMLKLTEVIEQSDDIRGTLTSLMWGNCKACHSKFREEH
jgi:cytochrome c556